MHISRTYLPQRSPMRTTKPRSPRQKEKRVMTAARASIPAMAVMCAGDPRGTGRWCPMRKHRQTRDQGAAVRSHTCRQGALFARPVPPRPTWRVAPPFLKAECAERRRCELWLVKSRYGRRSKPTPAATRTRAPSDGQSSANGRNCTGSEPPSSALLQERRSERRKPGSLTPRRVMSAALQSSILRMKKKAYQKRAKVTMAGTTMKMTTRRRRVKRRRTSDARERHVLEWVPPSAGMRLALC
mmetsp:Transcript_26157/g.64826  ORF Transcript_26157/g.64826 Transcript_26157/m.64826 type:complete len:242 (-) Transcript_26157:1130-1855(-)